jgi:putative endonuclease
VDERRQDERDRRAIRRGWNNNYLSIPAEAGIHSSGYTMYYVYLLTSKLYGTLYIGWTTDLVRRVWEHKNKVVPGFTAKYGVDRLVWFESHDNREAALRREKQIKGWKRDWKINLIESQNRYWTYLYDSLPGT